MGDLISINWVTKPFEDAMDDIRRTDGAADRATKYALRATGRAMVRVAKANAPVYKGTDPRAVAEKGNLRRSIANARKLTGDAATGYTLKVGPFGTKKKGTDVRRTGPSRREGGTSGQVRGVPLYRAKMEAKYGFMAAAVGMGDAAIRQIYEDAMAKALAKYR